MQALPPHPSTGSGLPRRPGTVTSRKNKTARTVRDMKRPELPSRSSPRGVQWAPPAGNWSPDWVMVDSWTRGSSRTRRRRPAAGRPDAVGAVKFVWRPTGQTGSNRKGCPPRTGLPGGLRLALIASSMQKLLFLFPFFFYIASTLCAGNLCRSPLRSSQYGPQATRQTQRLSRKIAKRAD